MVAVIIRCLKKRILVAIAEDTDHCHHYFVWLSILASFYQTFTFISRVIVSNSNKHGGGWQFGSLADIPTEIRHKLTFALLCLPLKLSVV